MVRTLGRDIPKVLKDDLDIIVEPGLYVNGLFMCIVISKVGAVAAMMAMK